MTPHAAEVLTRFDALNKTLEAHGFPAISPWWRQTIRRWYASGRRRLVPRVGRRGGKSSSLCRLGVVEALYGQHNIPPGDVGVVAIVSARRPDAMDKLRTIKAILDALRVPYTERGETIELTGRRVVFTVFTASIAGVSGFTSIFVFLDEVAKWRDSDTGANPAGVVISSIAPTLATQPNARMVLSSSPMGLLDAHADAFAQGETPLQVTAHATTWEANPTLTEEGTRLEEPDPVVWAREYAAIPQAEAETSLLSAVLVDRATRASLDIEPDDRHRYVATMDPATRGNAWTLIVASLSDNHVRCVVLAREWVGSKAKPLSPSAVFQEAAALLKPYGLSHVYSDQFAEDALRELARPHGLYLIVDAPWTAATKADAYDGLRALMQEGRLEIPNDSVVKNDLLGIRIRLTRTGTSYELASQGSRHSDYAPAIAMAVSLCRVPCTPVVTKKTLEQEAEAFKETFLLERTKERKRKERFGRAPVTHSRLHTARR